MSSIRIEEGSICAGIIPPKTTEKDLLPEPTTRRVGRGFDDDLYLFRAIHAALCPGRHQRPVRIERDPRKLELQKSSVTLNSR